jgi:SAM-dependent methyltransferase
MPLVELTGVSSLLACPRCQSRLTEVPDAVRCTSSKCRLGADGPFARIGRWPILVDFEHSILTRDELSREHVASAPAAHRWSVDRLPPRLRSLWKPRNRVAARNADLLLALLAKPSPLVLIVGGGTMGNGMEAVYANPDLRLLAFDIYGSPLTQLIADAHQIPLASESVDAVIIQAVMEHVIDPPLVVGEIERVLRADGLVYAETPFLQQVHAGPYDFTRFTSSGHRYLFRGFDEILAGPVDGPGTQLLWSVDHAVRALFRSEFAGKLARGAFSWLRYLDRAVPAEWAMDNATAYFFLGRRSEKALAPHDIVAYYRGAQRARRTPS